MFFRRFEKAVAGWPKASQADNGTSIRLTGKYVHPAWKKRAERVSIALWILAAYLLWGSSADVGEWFFRSLFVIFAIAPAVYLLSYFAFRKNVDVKIGSEAILVKGPFGYKRYARSVPLEFRIDRHHKAVQEEVREAERGQRTDRVYRDAIEVVMQYGERGVVIAEMRFKDMEKAKALVFRLGSLNEAGPESLEEEPAGYEQLASAPVAAGEFGRSPDIR